MTPLAVVALGGNALLRRGEPAEASRQQSNVRAAATSIAVLGDTHRLVVTHGNGPQVGLLALQAEAYGDVRPYPLDVLGAETEGMIGYLLDQALVNVLPAGSRVATLLTQTVVDPADPAFAVPSKPIGPIYEPEVGERLARERGSGDATTRRHPSPSAATAHPRLVASRCAVGASYTGPMGFVGWVKLGSLASTTTWVRTVANRSSGSRLASSCSRR